MQRLHLSLLYVGHGHITKKHTLSRLYAVMEFIMCKVECMFRLSLFQLFLRH